MLVLQGEKQVIRGLAFTADGAAVAFGSGAAVRLWTPGAKSATTFAKAEDTVETLAMSPDGALLAAGLADGTICAWRYPSKRSALVGDVTFPDGVGRLAFAPDGKRFASVGWSAEILVWGANDPKPLLKTESAGRFVSVAWSPDGSTLAGGTVGGAVALYDAKKGTQQSLLSKKGAGVFALAFAPDGSALAAGDGAGKITLYDLKKGKGAALDQGHTWTVYGLAFSPDGRLMVSGGADQSVRVWDAEARRELAAYDWHGDCVTAVAFAPDGARAASASHDRTVVVWDVDR